jgi:fused signal recognition particle receptor
LRQQVNEHKLTETSELKKELKRQIVKILEAPAAHAEGNGAGPSADLAKVAPRVIFVVGVNGTGKTTTIGKLTNRLKKEGATVVLCAADTFRAAAIEQLEVWARRSGVEVIKQKSGADPSAVVFDAITSARAHSADVVIVDTAGRLHTKSNLMAELDKMKRTAAKIVPGAPHDVLLVLDATTGQNGLNQAREFWSHAGVTGIVLTKLDGTAKGGIVVAIAQELKLPVKFVGVGEKIDDLLPFDPKAFTASLLTT